MSTREGDLKARMAAGLMARPDAVAQPAQGSGQAASTPLTLDAVRSSPLGMLLEVLVGMSPAGPAADAANVAAAKGDPAQTALAAAGFLPILGDLLRSLFRGPGQEAAQGAYQILGRQAVQPPAIDPKQGMALAKQVQGLLQEGRATEAQQLLRAMLDVDRTPLEQAPDLWPLTHRKIMSKPKGMPTPGKPARSRDAMLQSGRDPARVFNDIDLGNPISKLPDISGGNFTRSLRDFAPSVFRETSLSKLEDVLPTGRTIADPGELFFGTKNMARGQGKNKGVLLEFDTEGLTGAVNTAKPGWKAAYEQGDAEFVGRQLKQSALQNNLRSVTINPEAIFDNVTKRRLGPVLVDLEKAGWLKLPLEGGAVQYLHPTRAPK